MTEIEGVLSDFIADVRSREEYDYLGFLAGYKADPAHLDQGLVRVAMTPADAFYAPEKPIGVLEQINIDKNMLVDEVLHLYATRLRKGEPLTERQRCESRIWQLGWTARQAAIRERMITGLIMQNKQECI